MKINNYISIGISALLLSGLIADNWSLQINSINFDSSIPGDIVMMGVCEGCHDGFHFNEDEVDLPPGPIPMTNIQFKNPNWIGQEDSNGNICEYTSFYSDFRSVHEPSDLLIWEITGSCPASVLESSNMFQLSWTVDSLSQEYEIYMYTGSTPVNMRFTTAASISCDILTPTWNIVDGEWITVTPSIKILMGGCASSGLTTFFSDDDGDGLGSELSSEFCAGFQPEGWVNNSDDVDDTIFCESNDFDSCWVCDGNDTSLDCAGICDPSTPVGEIQEEEGHAYGAFIDDCGLCSEGNTNHGANSDQDCNEDCFGVAYLDDCGQCSGGSSDHEPNSDQDCLGECFGDAFFDFCDACGGYNSSCLELVFGSGPSDLYAHINSEANQIDLTWVYSDINISDQVSGYKIYQQIDGNLNQITSIELDNGFFYSIDGYSDGLFCLSAFDLYENETTPICADASEFSNFMFNLADGANLISFPYLSNDDATPNTIFEPISDYSNGIISEGIASTYNSYLDMWQGTIQEIERRKGYWLKVDLLEDQNTISLSVSGIPTNPNTIYTLHDGANLVSYIGPDSLAVGNAIPNNIEDLVEAIIGEGVATTPNPVLGWVGSLDEFNLGKGYGIKMVPDISDVDMIWNSDSGRSDLPSNKKIRSSSDFAFNQSTLQAFYFIESVLASSFILDEEDIVVSYCNDIIVGSRYYSGSYTDVPAMGEDGERTSGYCKEGDTPLFKIFDSESGRMVELKAENLSAWSNLGISFINLQEPESTSYHPSSTQIVSVYPNPFNPAATIKFELDKSQEINFSVFSIDGRLVDVILNQKMEAGAHSVNWNSTNNPSGIYIIRLTSKENTYSTKALLVK